MKSNLVRMLFGLVCSLVLAAPVFAQPVPGPTPVSPPVPIDGSDWWRDVIRRYDTNGNGKLDPDEWNRFWQDMQEDELGDPGYLEITWEEFLDMLRRMYPGIPEQDVRNLFREIDTNGDGIITWDEWKRFQRRVNPQSSSSGGAEGEAEGTAPAEEDAGPVSGD